MARQILVVDDDKLNRLTTKNILNKLGFEVVVLDDGRGAVDAEATGVFDAILMDCQMPHMDGFQATTAIRRHQLESHRARTPVIGVSARAMEGDEEVAISKGMDAYITKPVSVRKVRDALERVCVDSEAPQAGRKAGLHPAYPA